MSLPSSNEERIAGAAPRHRKAQPDIYTVLLAIALVAIIMSIVLLYLETADYGDQKYRGALPVYLESTAAAAPIELASLSAVGRRSLPGACTALCSARS